MLEDEWNNPQPIILESTERIQDATGLPAALIEQMRHDLHERKYKGLA